MEKALGTRLPTRPLSDFFTLFGGGLSAVRCSYATDSAKNMATFPQHATLPVFPRFASAWGRFGYSCNPINNFKKENIVLFHTER